MPADLHGFVIRDAGDGEHLYGVSLRGQKFVKLTLDGEIVLEISRDAIPREYCSTGADARPSGRPIATRD